MTRFLVDNSVIQRLARSPSAAAAVRRLDKAGHVLCAAPTSVLEAGYSARSKTDHDTILSQLIGPFEMLPLTEAVGSLAIEFQQALFATGRGRAAGVIDLLQAATAAHHGATLLHYDADFEMLAEVDGRLGQAWVVPRGSID